jgi:hypothetical protein
MTLAVTVDEAGLTLAPQPERRGVLGRARVPTIDEIVAREASLAGALGDLEALAEELGETVVIRPEGIRIPHRLAAALPAGPAQALGLPPTVHLTLAVDAEGVPGQPGFRLVTEWRERGRRVLPRRTGAILSTAEGERRLPLWMFEAIEAAEGLNAGTGSEEAHWAALAHFRAALDPALGSGDAAAARLAITDFLRGLEVRLADSFGIAPRGGADFDVLPFDRRKLPRIEDGELIEDEAAELSGGDLAGFQAAVRRHGALRAYRLAAGRYLAIEPDALPALELMAAVMRESDDAQRAFLRNPRAAISRRIEDRLRAKGALAGLSDEGIAEAIERAATPLFTETRGYAERVLGVAPFVRPPLPPGARPTTTWLPEAPDALAEAIAAWDAETLRRAIAALRAARDRGDQTVTVAGIELPVDDSLIRALIERLRLLEADGGSGGRGAPAGPALVLETLDNLARLNWNPAWVPRPAPAAPVPIGLATLLRPHQRAAFDWQVAAWAAGAPGILNADEQGLGKTLETLAFLRWLAEQPGSASAPAAPVLIVAPTSLLETWAGEAERHLDDRGLGTLLRLYGAGLERLKRAERRPETATGEAHLDLSSVEAAIDAGRGRDFWLLTTYDTLVNYQHSLARLPFAAVVFDEAQAIKNPATMRHTAARALKADFRIALTGTPIENTTAELWAILDVIAPGALGTLRDFMARFGTAEPGSMARLRRLLFDPQEGRPPLALRRLKDEVAGDLPAKTRRLHPVLMPPRQAAAYDAVRIELAGIADGGGALRLLHRLRTVALHPDPAGEGEGEGETGSWAAASARLSAALALLDRLSARGERALIFLEHRRAQHRLRALLQRRYGLARIDILNGDTPIDRRRAIVAHFQRHLVTDEGFDLMILGPRAAGVGLTLTAASHVIHLSRWWNPAVEEQCNDRVHRIGQTRPVEVHLPIAVHPGFGPQSFDCRLQALMMRKARLSRAVLWPMGDSQEDVAALIDELERGRSAAQQSAETALIDTLEEFQPEVRWRIEDGTIVLE